MLLKKERQGLGKDCILVKIGRPASDEVYVYSMGTLYLQSRLVSRRLEDAYDADLVGLEARASACVMAVVRRR